MERPWWQGTKEGLWPPVSEEQRPSVQYLTWNWVLSITTGMSLEVAPSSVKSSDQTVASAHSLITDSKRPKGRDAHSEHWDTLPYKSQKHTGGWKIGAISQVTQEKQLINPHKGSWDSAQFTWGRGGASFKDTLCHGSIFPPHPSHSQMYTSSLETMTGSWPAETETVNVCGLKLLNFEVICYIVIGN